MKSKQHKNILFVALLGLSLIAFQSLQASELHEHSEHSAECFLFHVNFGDDSEIEHPQPCLNEVQGVQLFYTLVVSSFSNLPNAYQGRAPPSFLNIS